MFTEAECEGKIDGKLASRAGREGTLNSSFSHLGWNFNNFQLKLGRKTICLFQVASSFNNPRLGERLRVEKAKVSEEIPRFIPPACRLFGSSVA
jgi:hypothetical protein